MKNNIGVYICQCGSNISDYVDVEKVRDEVSKIEGVAIAKTTMFACADSTQKEIIEDVRNKKLDAMVVASCSPKLHLFTFRNVAIRAGLNPYHYVQVNIREQDSWAHSDHPAEATLKAIGLVSAGIARVKHSKALKSIDIPSRNAVAILGAGVSGMRAAIEMADMGTEVHLIEREHFVGGRTSQWSQLFTTRQSGEEVVSGLYNKIINNENISLYTGAELLSMKGSVGDFKAKIRIIPRYIKADCILKDNQELLNATLKAINACPVEISDDFNFNITKRKAIYKNYHSEFPECPAIDYEHCTKCGECAKYLDAVDFEQKEQEVEINVGAFVVATGFDPYEPEKGEYAYAEVENVITLPQFKRLIEMNEKELTYRNKAVKNIAYIYCVGSRQTEGKNNYCSRHCCTSAIHAAIHARNKYRDINNFHINRGIRTYGKQELLYEESSRNGDIYLQFDEENIPVVEKQGEKLIIKVKDILTQEKELEVEADLLVLVTGMVPRKHSKVSDILKIPLGRDHFFNEIHPKLKPVETVIDGVFICGACQAPFNITETIKSSLSAASKANALISKGKIELEPTIAEINPEQCSWCGACTEVCLYDAIRKIGHNGKEIAEVDESKCKGCGMCLPVCDQNAINLIGYTDKEIESFIDALIS
ncbi:MAG: CoB--CoM heterodisulfide reductase iron-sulfur subunit A family protein [Bacteroidales bacterium]|nr:CoB--CoM heterodisulfide reductase iron-sulfur subunit A family protein [Bacteroidales bacterium]